MSGLVVWFAVGGLALACGDPDKESASNKSETGGNAGWESETGGAQATGGTSSVSGGGGGTADQGPESSRWIVPFDPERHWYYEASVLDPQLPVKSCVRPESWVDRELTVQPPGATQVTTAWVYYPSCTDKIYIVWQSDGTVYATPVEEPIEGVQSDIVYVYFVDPNVDTSWTVSAQGPSFDWVPAEATTVPAGTFSDCWRRNMVGSDDHGVYCRGVGMVSWVSVTDNYALALSRFTAPNP